MLSQQLATEFLHEIIFVISASLGLLYPESRHCYLCSFKFYICEGFVILTELKALAANLQSMFQLITFYPKLNRPK